MDEITRKKRIGNNIQQFFGGFNIKWFLCFGTLLNYVRQPKKFDISHDIDIGIIGSDIELFYNQINGAYRIEHYIKSDDTGKFLNLCYYDERNGVFIDIYKWVKFKGMYWHTYDVLADADKNGIPSKYIFKSMPKEVFERDPEDVKIKRQDTRYGRILTKHGTWLKTLPELPAEGIALPVPSLYGYFLDIAYPEWATTRAAFGVSEAYSTFETKSCENYVEIGLEKETFAI
jgi:phosphorylcholine metabolism protein LicD